MGNRAGKSIIVVAVAALACFALPATASAENLDLNDAEAVIEAIAPEVLLESTTDTSLSLGDAASGSKELGSSSPPRVSLVEIPTASGEAIPGIEFTIDYAEPGAESQGALEVLPATSTDVASYVQATPSGVRVLTALASSKVPEAYSYTFDVPDGTRLLEVDGSGKNLLIAPDGTSYGSLGDPWARDLAGKELPTHYQWENGTLTQYVDLSGDVAFPVLLDPNWSYAMSWHFGSYGAWSPAGGGLAGLQYDYFKSCFNCHFQLSGSPHDFPAFLDVVPLYMSLGVSGYVPFTVRMAGDFYSPTEYWGWMFNAESGHIDGLGSDIMFLYVAGTDGYYQYVTANIVNDFVYGNGVYQAGAYLQWSALFDRVKTGPYS